MADDRKNHLFPSRVRRHGIGDPRRGNTCRFERNLHEFVIFKIVVIIIRLTRTEMPFPSRSKRIFVIVIVAVEELCEYDNMNIKKI